MSLFGMSTLEMQLILLGIVVILIVISIVRKATLNKVAFKILNEEEFMERSKNKMIDTRPQNDFDFDHIKGARCMPSMDFKLKPVTLRKDQAIYLYDYNNKKSAAVARTLYKKGYKEIYILNGGLVEYTGETKGRLVEELKIAAPKGKR